MKLTTFLATTALAGVVSVMAGAASASIVYNNGAPNTTSGNETVAWVQSEDFSFGANTSVTGAGVYLAGSRGNVNGWDGNFQYYVFADNSGSPGTVLASGSVTPTVTDTGNPWCCTGDAYLFAFNFGSAFAAAANTTYHLGIHAGATGNFGRDEIYWVSTAANATTAGIESSGGTFNNWSGNGNEHAFYLTGDAANAGVPEPASWALMISGFGLAGASLRRRRAVAA